MNPYFEQSWGDVHARIIIHACEQLCERLPEDLSARAEEGVSIDAEEYGTRGWRPDVKISEPFGEPQPASYGGIAVATPVLIPPPEIPERWIEIRDSGGHLVTTLEVLSPANKLEPGLHAFRRKRAGHLRAGVNFVEIDLIREGGWLLDAAALRALRGQVKNHCHLITVFRASLGGAREAYPISLREPLPAFRVPLRPSDEDVILELQPIIDRIYVSGRYWFTDTGRDAEPPLGTEDAHWLDATLRSAGLRT